MFMFWQQTASQAQKEQDLSSAIKKVNDAKLSEGWVADYVDAQLAKEVDSIDSAGSHASLRTWVDQRIVGAEALMTAQPVVRTAGTTVVQQITNVQPGVQVTNVVNAAPSAQPVTLAGLAPAGCTPGQVLKYDGSEWGCAADALAGSTVVSGAANRLAVFDTASGMGASYVLQDTQGLVLDAGKDLRVGGSIFGDGSHISGLGGSQLTDATVTTAKLADGAVTLDKLAPSGCATGQTLKWSGSAWACAIDIDTDTDTLYSAGDGLALNGGVFSSLLGATVGAAEIEDGAVTTAKIVDYSITDAKLLDGAVSAAKLAPGAVGEDALANQSVATAKISDGAVTGLKLADGSVNGLKLADSSVSAGKLAAGSVTTAKLADGSVSAAKLAQNGCAAGQLLKWGTTAWSCSYDTDTDTIYSAGDGLVLNAGVFSSVLGTSIDNAELADGAVGTSKIATGSVSADKLADGSVSAVKLSDGAVGGTKLADGSITSGKLVDGSVTATKLADGSVSASKLAQNGCTAGQLLKWNGSAWACAADIDTDTDTNTIYGAGTGLQLVANTFSLDLSHANAWSGTQSFNGGITVGGATYSNLAGTGLSTSGGTLSSTLGTSIDTSEIADSAVTSAKILDGSVVSADMADSAVTSAKILDGTISGADIASGAITAANVADGSLTATKLSTAVRKRTASTIVNIPLALLSTQEQPMFIAPTNGTITKVSFISGNAVVAASTLGTISVERKSSPAATVASISLSSIGLTALAPAQPALSGGTGFSAGDIYVFKYAPGVAGVALTNMLVSIEYTVSE